MGRAWVGRWVRTGAVGGRRREAGGWGRGRAGAQRRTHAPDASQRHLSISWEINPQRIFPRAGGTAGES